MVAAVAEESGLQATRLGVADRLEKVGLKIEDTKLIDEYAPYRRKRPAWPFFFYSPDPERQQTLQSASAWQPS